MANLIKWLGNTAHNVENAVGGAVQGVERAAAPIIRPVAQQVSPVVNAGVRAVGQAIQHPSVQTVQAIPRAVTGAALQQGSRNLMGVTNAIGSSPVVRPVAQFKMPLVGSVGAGVNGLVNEGVIQPFARATGTIGGAMQGQRVQDPRQFLSDVAQTGLNVASGGEGGVALRGAEAGAKQLFKAAGREALVQGKIGAGQGAVQAFRDNAKPLQAATDVVGGGVLGAAGGAAIPFVGAGARAAARGAGDVIKGTTPAIQSVIDKYKASPLADQSGKIGLGQDVTTASQPRKINGQFDQHDLASRPAVNPNDRIAVSKQLINVNSELQSPAVQDFHSRLAEFHGTPGEGAMWQTPLGQRIGSLNEYRNYLSELQAAHGAEGRPVLAPKMSVGRPNMTPQSNGSNFSKLLGNMRTTFGNERGAIGLGQDIGGSQPPPEPPMVPSPSGGMEPKLPYGTQITENGFTKSVKNAPSVDPAVQAMVSGQDVVRNTKALAQRAEEFARSGSVPDAVAAMHDALATTSGHINDEVVARGINVANKAAAAGMKDDAASIYDQLAEHLRATGRTAQAASLLLSETPEGKQFRAIRILKKAGVDLSPEDHKALSDLTDPQRKTDPGTQARYEADQKLAKFVNRRIPASKVDLAFRLWRTGLLTGPQTMTKVGLSHLVMNVMEGLSDVSAAGLDATLGRGLSKVMTGKAMRSTATTLRGQEAFASGTRSAGKLLLKGVDDLNTGGLSHFNTDMGHSTNEFKSPWLKWLNPYMNKTEQIHAAIPKGFYTAAYKNDLNKQAIAEFKNSGLPYSQRGKFISNFVKNPSAEAADEAKHKAQMATFQQDTKLGVAAQKMRSVPGGRELSPFAHIASSILTDALNYSPVGAVKSVIEAVRDNGAKGWTPVVQKHFMEGLGRSITGTAILGAGVALYKAGVMTLDYPKDPKEAGIWKEQRKTPQSILINGQWRQLASLGPAAITLGMGGYAAAGQEVGGKGNSALTALAGALKTLSDESFLSGVTGAAGAINNPEMSAKSFFKNEASSLVPIALGTVARATDPLARQTNSVTQAIESKIPGLRERLLPSQTVFGNDVPRQGGVMTNLLDPTRPSDQVTSPVLDELNRLDLNHNTTDAALVKTIGSGRDATKLTPDQTYTRQQTVGPQIEAAYKSVMSSPGYAALSDENKAKALTNAAGDVNSVGNVQTLTSVAPDKAQKAYNALTANQKAMLNGQSSVRDYTALDDSGRSIASSTSLDPKVKFAQDLASYQQQIKAGLLTPEDQYTKGYALAQDQIKSNYPAEVTTLYGMSKTQLANFIAQHPDKEKLLPQVVALDQELASKGFTQTAKFKYGESSIVAANGSGGFTPASSSTSKSGGGRAKKAPSKISSPKVKVTLATAKLVARTHLPRSGNTIHAPKVKMAKAVKTPKLATAKPRKARLA